MNIFDLLAVDHARQRGLMKSILEPTLHNRARQQLFEELRAELMAHAAAEEQTLYAELLVNAREQIQQSVTSNDRVAELAFQLHDLDVESSQWLARFTDLKAEVESHLDLEETQLVPRARKLVKRGRAKHLGKSFKQMKLRELCLDGGCPLERPAAANTEHSAPAAPKKMRQPPEREFSSQAGGRVLRRRAISGGLSREKGG